MPAEFQKALNYIVVGHQKTYCFLDDIIIVITGPKCDHLSYVIKCLKILDDDNFRIILQNYHFAKTEIEWLGYKFTRTGLSLLENKTKAIVAIPPLPTFKRLRSFRRSLHYKFIPNLAQLCHPLRHFLKKSTKFFLTEMHTKHFNIMKDKFAANCYYNPKLVVRVKCDASRSVLDATLEQNTPDGNKYWFPLSCMNNSWSC